MESPKCAARVFKDLASRIIRSRDESNVANPVALKVTAALPTLGGDVVGSHMSPSPGTKAKRVPRPSYMSWSSVAIRPTAR